jgi:hypothetical protein
LESENRITKKNQLGKFFSHSMTEIVVTHPTSPRTAIEMNWIPAFAGMTDEEKINRGSWDLFNPLVFPLKNKGEGIRQHRPINGEVKRQHRPIKVSFTNQK